MLIKMFNHNVLNNHNQQFKVYKQNKLNKLNKHNKQLLHKLIIKNNKLKIIMDINQKQL